MNISNNAQTLPVKNERISANYVQTLPVNKMDEYFADIAYKLLVKIDERFC